MSKQVGKHQLDPETVALATQVAVAESPSDSQNPDTELAELRTLLSRHLKKELQEKEESFTKEAEAREQRIKQVQIHLDEIEKNRDMCSHRKPDGKTALGGQRNFDGKYRFQCSICNRTFTHPAEGLDEHAVPPELLPPTERIGSSMGG